MPTEHSAVCTMQWMHGVRTGSFYCPRLSDLKPQVVCLHPPPKAVLLEKIEATTQRQFEEQNASDADRLPYEKTIARLHKHPADCDWLVKILAIADENDEIFAKHYKYVKPTAAVIEPAFDNDDHFWDNIAPLTEREIRQGNRLRLTPAQRHSVLLRRLERKKEQIAAYEKKLLASA